jgi:hypothetical protein
MSFPRRDRRRAAELNSMPPPEAIGGKLFGKIYLF